MIFGRQGWTLQGPAKRGRNRGGGMQRGERRTIFGSMNHIGLSSTRMGRQGWMLEGPVIRGRGMGGLSRVGRGIDIWHLNS